MIISGTVLLAGVSGDDNHATLLRVNADGTIPSTGGGSGTVTSVGVSVPAILTVTGSPVTSSGVIAISLATQTQNNFFAGPASGADATPTFRLIVSNDIPNVLNATAIGGSLVSGVTLGIPVAPTTSASYGVISLGSGGFAGGGAPNFTGSASGTKFALNAAAGYAGNMIDYQVAGVRKTVITGAGRLGISGSSQSADTGFPAAPLHVVGTEQAGIIYERYAGAPSILTRFAGGSATSPTNPALGNFLMSLRYGGWVDTAFTTDGAFSVLSGEAWDSTHHGSYILLATVPLASTTAANRVAIDGTGAVQIAGPMSWAASITVTSGLIVSDLYLYRQAANILAQRNSTNAQEQQWYGTYTDASNYERFVVRMVAAGTTIIGNEKAGTGTARALAFTTNGTTALTISTAQISTFTGQILGISGSQTTTGYGFSSATAGYGFYYDGNLGFAHSGARKAYITSTTFGLDISLLVINDVTLARLGAASLRIGAAPSATPVSYTLTIGESSRGGTDVDIAGGNATIQSGAGTGAGAVTSIIFNTPTVGTTGSVQQVQAARLTLSSAGAVFTGVITNSSGTATPAGGSTAARLLFGTTAGFGIYYGSSSPTVSAAKGSIYLRSDGTGTTDRAYINTDGSTTWTALTTVA